ncbi:MAG TPA: Holliday junction resolvase RuvX [bacterium]|nr:Holliday junction resolvase RuvX [bacterium]HQI48643.1 Holliday junction resolvase RuvX [bacterium]HQJ66109.1 Holliday junction resolvase RuvX [bacterium]
MAALDPIPLHQLPLGRLLGIDYGEKRIGVAVSDPSQTIASPLVTLFRRGTDLLIAEIVSLVQEQAAVAIIVGLPLHMNGRRGDKAEAALMFAGLLAKAVPVPVFTLDERWTTASAHKSLIERGRHPSRERDKVDQIAAAFLVQAFVDRLQYCRRHPPES